VGTGSPLNIDGAFPEPLHLSYSPISMSLVDLRLPQSLRDAIMHADMFWKNDRPRKDAFYVYETQVLKIAAWVLGATVNRWA
jgi:hypothetical protein